MWTKVQILYTFCKNCVEKSQFKRAQENLRERLCNLLQASATSCKLVQAPASFCKLVQSSAGFWKLVQTCAGLFRLLKACAIFCKLLQSCADLCRLLQASESLCNFLQASTILCKLVLASASSCMLLQSPAIFCRLLKAVIYQSWVFWLRPKPNVRPSKPSASAEEFGLQPLIKKQKKLSHFCKKVLKNWKSFWIPLINFWLFNLTDNWKRWLDIF